MGQLISFKTQRIFSVIMLENVPQLMLQTWYILQQQNDESIIAISSAVFSAVSIIVTVLSMFMERSLIKSQEHTLISIDVCGQAMNYRKCKGRVNGIKKAISSMIGVDEGLMEMMKIETIQKGLRIKIDLAVTNETSKKEKYSEILEKVQMNGSLAKMISDCWKLNNVPNVTSVKCRDFESRQMTKRVKMREGAVKIVPQDSM